MVQNGVLNKSMCDAGEFFGCMLNASRKTIADDFWIECVYSKHCIVETVPLTISKEECPQDCLSFEYQQYVSFSELSTSRINNVLPSNQRDAIRQQYLISRVILMKTMIIVDCR